MNEVEIIEKAIQHLPESWRAEYVASRGSNQDGFLNIFVNNQSITFVLECKQIHRKESLNRFIKSKEENLLLVCEPLSDFLRNYCEQNHINFLDSVGNMRIIHENLYAIVQGRKSKYVKENRLTYQAMSIGIAKCLFAFFAEDTLLNKTYKEIAVKANISLGMVNKTIQYLVQNNHISNHKKQRRFLNIKELYYQWLLAYDAVLYPKLKSAPLPPPIKWQSVQLEENELWGGEVLASQLVEILQPEKFLLFSHTMNRRRNYALNPQSKEPLVLAQAFWGEQLDINNVGCILLAIAELLRSKDGRNREVAEIINDEYLHLKQLP